MGNTLRAAVDIREVDAILAVKLLTRNPALEAELEVSSVSIDDIYFLKIPLDTLETFIASPLGSALTADSGTLPAVGSGCWRLDLTPLMPNITLERHREAPCIIAGTSVIRSSIYCIPISPEWKMSDPLDLEVETISCQLPREPFLLVTVKAGTSFFHVTHGEVVRMGGSPIGGATLKSLTDLTPPTDYPLDLLVSDIYGSEGAPASVGLPGYAIASVFGKAETKSGSACSGSTSLKSLANLFAMNTAQLSYLHASLAGCSSVVFAFVEPLADQLLPVLVHRFLHFWSKGSVSTVFLAHADLLACAGALATREAMLENLTPGRLPEARDTITFEEHRYDETYTSLLLSSSASEVESS